MTFQNNLILENIALDLGLAVENVLFTSFLGAKAPLGLVRVSESVSQSVSQ